MQLTFRGSVNRWECDENDHLNVRFCEQKLYQTMVSGLIRNGCLEPSQVAELPQAIMRQHIRFQAESRLAAPLGGYFSFVQGPGIQVAVELRHEVTGAVACSMLCDFAPDSLDPKQVLKSPMMMPEDLTHLLPRGITQDLNLYHLSIEDASAMGFSIIGAGVIEADECSESGLLLPYRCMGRISDSMPHLWGAIFPERQASEEEGGAVVEFRRCYDGVLRSGEPFQVMSGVVEVGPRVQSFAHLIFNPHTGRCCVNAQAVALRMDLRARKAITMDQQALDKLNAKKIQLP